MEFSENALQKLIQLFPELSSYIVSFKDISEETGKEESGLRVGIFILQLGQEYYFIPVIAKSDTVLPIDSLFSNSDGKFYPLTKTFLDQAISSSQVTIGKATKIPKTVPTNPSVYDLVTPPRTGKFVYASSSRLVEFLANMPNMVKKAMTEKFAEDKEIYETLHKLFGLENVLAALKPSIHGPKAVLKPAVELITEGRGLDNPTVASILEKGYALRGENTTERVAVLANDFDSLGPLQLIGGVDSGKDYEVVTSSGEIKPAYIPKRAQAAPKFAALLRPYDSNALSQDPVLAIFSNGDYAISSQIVSRGEAVDTKKVLKDLFGVQSPIVPRDVVNYSKIAIFSPELNLVGAYSVHHVNESNVGVTIKASNLLPGNESSGVTINAYRNCKVINAADCENIFIPYNALIVVLHHNISGKLETNINSALAKLELSTLTALGTAVDIGFDGIEFSFNGKPVGPEVKMVEMLVVKEGIAPNKADSFIKQAKEQKHVKIYLSKKADFEPGEIPQYGDIPADQENTFGADVQGAAIKNIRSAIDTQDPQTIESTIISELIQATNMTDLVREYLPDIQEAIDKLGRTLFLARLNMDQLSQSQNANELLAFISNIRNVYRLLGDNFIKLQRMCGGPEQPILTEENKVQ